MPLVPLVEPPMTVTLVAPAPMTMPLLFGVDEGPTMKRFRPRAQGRAYRIRKRLLTKQDGDRAIGQMKRAARAQDRLRRARP